MVGYFSRSFGENGHRKSVGSKIAQVYVVKLLLFIATITGVFALNKIFSCTRHSSSDNSEKRAGVDLPRAMACPVSCPGCTQMICPLPVCGDMVCNCPPHVNYDSLALLVGPSQHDLHIRRATSTNNLPSKHRFRSQTVEMLVDLKRPSKYHDLPLRPNGVLCIVGLFGQLNNQVIEMYHGIALAHRMDRTLVAFEEFSRLIDVSFFQNMFPTAKGKVVLAYNEKLCIGAHPLHRFHFKVPKNWLPQLPAISMSAATFFHAEIDIPETQTAFYKNLMPQWETQQLVDEFVERSFGNKPFVAVHLRWLEGHCPLWNGGQLCSLSPFVLDYIIKIRAPELKDYGIFIASDSQRRDIETILVKKRHAVMFGDHYAGKCHGRQCAHIDFEIASRANFFVGVEASSAARVIDRLRVLRPLGKGVMYESVLKWGLSWKEKKKKYKAEATASLRADGHKGKIEAKDLADRVEKFYSRDQKKNT